MSPNQLIVAAASEVTATIHVYPDDLERISKTCSTLKSVLSHLKDAADDRFVRYGTDILHAGTSFVQNS